MSVADFEYAAGLVCGSAIGLVCLAPPLIIGGVWLVNAWRSERRSRRLARTLAQTSAKTSALWGGR